MKKILFLLLAVVMCFCSCSNKKPMTSELTFILQEDSTVCVYENGSPFNGIAVFDDDIRARIWTDQGKFYMIEVVSGRSGIMDVYQDTTYYYDRKGNYITFDTFQKLYSGQKCYTYADILKLCK